MPTDEAPGNPAAGAITKAQARRALWSMGRSTEAHHILARVEIACKRVASDESADVRGSGCEAWQEFQAAVDGYRPTAP